MIGHLPVTGKSQYPMVASIEPRKILSRGFASCKVPNRRVPVFFYLLEAEQFAEIITFRAAHDVESPVTEII
jgi:hypothetical protein